MSIPETIIQAMAGLDDALLLDEVRQAVDAGVERMDIITALQQGMANIGTRFSNLKYFLSELMLAAEVLVECQQLLGGEQESDTNY